MSVSLVVRSQFVPFAYYFSYFGPAFPVNSENQNIFRFGDSPVDHRIKMFIISSKRWRNGNISKRHKIAREFHFVL